MTQQTYGFLYGILAFLIGIVFTFFYKKIINIQGESKKGDIPMNQRIQKFKIGGIGLIILGIILILSALSSSK
ncbi:FtsX-like permease family protein [Calditrichota bacterium GD2]